MKSVKVDAKDPDPKAIQAAAKVLREGGLVIFPTETVYGLGANAEDPKAIARLYEVKKRPPGKPLTVQVDSKEMMQTLGVQWTASADQLSARFWPGPLTLVLARGDNGTLGVRVPRHPVAVALLKEAQVPIAAPSANISEAPPPVSVEEIDPELSKQVDLVLDSGVAQWGKSSTVVDCTKETPEILREGAMVHDIMSALEQITLDHGK